MSKLKQSKQVSDDAETLIRMQNEYIDKLRNIVARFYIEHGGMIAKEKCNLGVQIDFEINADDKSAFIEVIDYEILGVRSDFMKIQELNKKLEL